MKTDTKNSGRHFGTSLMGWVLLSALVLAASSLGAAEKPQETERDAAATNRVETRSSEADDRDESTLKASATRSRVTRHHVPRGYRYHRPGVHISWSYPYAHFGLFHLPIPSVYVGTESRVSHGELGAMDLDITPEEAQIYLDGELIGTADNFDGFPEFLWLEEGTYDLVFYHPNYETIARQVTIYGGVVIDVDDNMKPGTGVRPEDLVSKSTVNRDERMRRERERQIEAERWERARERDAVGRLVLKVWPEDTALYLNGHFLGTGDELSQLSAGLIIAPGKHMLEAVHPEYESEEITISVDPGERIDLEIELKRP